MGILSNIQQSFDWSHHMNPSYFSVNPVDKTDYSKYLNLSSNELLHTSVFRLLKNFWSTVEASTLYHYPYYRNFVETCARHFGVVPEQVTVVAGSDDGIKMIVDAIASKSRRIILHSPNYRNYENYANLRSIELDQVRYVFGQSVESRLDNLLNALSYAQPSAVALANPNGFDGISFEPSQIGEIAELSASKGHAVVIDEAYAAFSNWSAVGMLDTHPNMIVLSSFSKTYGAAGFRLGVILASESVTDYLKRWFSTGPVSTVAMLYGSYCIENADIFDRIYKDLEITKKRLVKTLNEKYRAEVAFLSKSNFIVLKQDSKKKALALVKKLDKAGVKVRTLANVTGFGSCVRMTVGEWSLMSPLLTLIEAGDLIR